MRYIVALLTQPTIARGIDRSYGDRCILSGVEAPDGGTVERPARSDILCLTQAVSNPIDA